MNLANMSLFITRILKIEPRGEPGQYVGPDPYSTGYRIWINNKIQVERNVQFLDNPHIKIEGENTDNSKEHENIQPDDLLPREQRKRTLTKRARGINYDENQMMNISIYLTEFNQFNSKQLGDPTTYKDAINRPDSYEWMKAMKDEIDTLIERGTWEIVNPPPRTNIIGTKICVQIKVDT